MYIVVTKHTVMKFARDILSCIESAAFETLSIVKQGRGKKEQNINPGWSDEVIVLISGVKLEISRKPRNCELHRIMKTRNLYQYQYKSVRSLKTLLRETHYQMHVFKL